MAPTLLWVFLVLGAVAVYFLERIARELLEIKRLLAHRMGQNVN